MQSIFKQSLIGLGIGFLATVFIVLFLQFITLDFQWMFLFGCALFSYAGFLGGRRQGTRYLPFLIPLIVPITILFVTQVTPQLPSLIFMPAIFFITSVMGLYVADKKSFMSKTGTFTVGGGFLIVLVCVVPFFLIPGLIANDLTVLTQEPTPEFSFQDLDNNTFTKNDLKGKIVMIDFFGTWCRPCIAELPEIEKVHSIFKDNPDVQFFVVDSDQNGDTMEKLRKFLSKRNVSFPFGYDHGSQFHKSLGFTGVPSLVVIDQEGMIRLKHEGFNQSEDIAGTLENVINKLLREE